VIASLAAITRQFNFHALVYSLIVFTYYEVFVGYTLKRNLYIANPGYLCLCKLQSKPESATSAEELSRKFPNCLRGEKWYSV
jgi:hypothetical protein